LNKTSEDLKAWLNSHGFGHIADGIIWDRKAAQKDRARLRAKWEDATNLLISYMDDYKSTDKVLGRALIKAVFTVENGSWPKYVAFLRDRCGISASDERLNAIRQKVILLLSKLEGNEDFIKRISRN
jgi:hypothetical protein